MKDHEIEALLREAARREPSAEDPDVVRRMEAMPAERLDAIVRAVLPRAAPRRMSRARVAGIFAFAALVVAVVGASTIRERTLPEYTLHIAGNRAVVRAGGPHDTVDVHLARGAPFELVVRPDIRAMAPVTARFVLVRGGRAEAWAPPVEVDEGGSARVYGAREALFRDPSGKYLVFVVACPSADLPALDAPAIAAGARPAGCRVVSGSVTFDD